MRNLALVSAIGALAVTALPTGVPAAPRVPPNVSPPPASAALLATTDKLWNKLLVSCGQSYFYAGSELDKSDGPSAVIYDPDDAKILEFRGVRKLPPTSIRVSDAERLNGVTERARISMVANTYRVAGGAWQDGPSFVARSYSEQTNQMLMKVFGDDAQLGWAGAMVLDIARVNGRWVFRRGSLLSSVPLWSNGTFVDLERFLAKPISRYDCETGRASPRPPTDEEIANATAAADAKAREESLRAEAEERERPDRERRAAETAQFEAAVAELRRRGDIEQKRRPEMQRRERPWRFVGTFEQFKAALPAYIERRGKEFGFSAADYRGEVAAISRFAATCMDLVNPITRAGWSAPSPRAGNAGPVHECNRANAMFGVVVSPKDKPHGLTINRVVPDGSPTLRNFHIRVAVVPTAEDNVRNAAAWTDEIPVLYNVIDARLVYSGQVVPPQLLAWARAEIE